MGWVRTNGGREDVFRMLVFIAAWFSFWEFLGDARGHVNIVYVQYLHKVDVHTCDKAWLAQQRRTV